jgi:uncharacterized protein YbjT (DUF2867 family)
MKRVVILGASGTIGDRALRYALESPNVEQVLSVGRNNLGFSHPKLTEVLHPHFVDCSALAQTLSSQDAAVFCLGGRTGDVSQEELRNTALTFIAELARFLRDISRGVRFSFLRVESADPTELNRVAYACVKSVGQRGLVQAGVPHICIFRPAYMYPMQPRKESNLGGRMIQLAHPVFQLLGFPIRHDGLARAMVDASMGEAD